MGLTDCVIYSVVAAGILLWIVCFAVVERHKLAGLPSGVWVAFRALVWTALVSVWFSVLAAVLSHAAAFKSALTASAAEGAPVSAGGAFDTIYSGGGVVITLIVALALTVLSIYLYSSLWQLGAIQPRFTRRRAE